MKQRATRIAAISLVLLLLLAGAGWFGMHYATKLLKTQIETALGADSEVGEIEVGWSAVEIRALRIRAPKGWPAGQTLQAQRITVVPDLRGLLSDRSRVKIHRIVIDDAYLSVLRSRDGRLRLLPGLLDAPKKAQAADDDAIRVEIGTIELRGGVLELFDASVKQPAHKMRLENLQATLHDLHVPDLTQRIRMQVDGTITGPRQNGRMAIDGWMELAKRNSQLSTRLSGVDLIALQPYLLKATETGVKRGTLDLALRSTVTNNRLQAPGTVTLSNLELSERGGTFMNLPRQAVLAGMKNRNNQITIQFTLSGNLDDPKFSLNDSFAKNVGASVAGLLGISIESLTKNLGGAAEGVGSVVKKLFGQ